MIRNTVENRSSWYTFLSAVDDLQIFSICKHFDELTLDDNTGTSASSTSLVQSSSYGYRGSIHRFLRSWGPHLFGQSIIKQLRAPFIELPRSVVDFPLFQSNDLRMGIGFRFLPGQTTFLYHELKLPESFDKLTFLRKKMALSHSRLHSLQTMFSFSGAGAGLRSLVTEGMNEKVLVEVVSYFNGSYGRFLILVVMGIGCTVWYGFVPGLPGHPPDSSLFAPLESYNPFFDELYCVPLGFRKLSLIETKDISASVESVLASEPFAEVTIPANGPVLKSVGLGVMVAFFIVVGLLVFESGGAHLHTIGL